MANADNVRAWQSGTVLTAPVGTTAPTDIAGLESLDPAWKSLGILSEDAGAKWTTENTESDYYGWGTGLARKLFSKHKRSFVVTAAEENAVVHQLENPGSTATSAGGETTITVVTPNYTKSAFLVVEVDGAITRARIIDAGYVKVTPQGDGAEKVSEREVEVTIIPDAATGEIWTEITNDPAMVPLGITVSSIAVTPTTKTLAAAATQQLVVTATWSDSSTSTVTSLASYVSSDAAKATVSSGGLITAVATGSATITATYATKTATCAVTVS